MKSPPEAVSSGQASQPLILHRVTGVTLEVDKGRGMTFKHSLMSAYFCHWGVMRAAKQPGTAPSFLL